MNAKNAAQKKRKRKLGNRRVEKSSSKFFYVKVENLPSMGRLTWVRASDWAQNTDESNQPSR